jgi:hypothetical protein
VRAVVQEAWAQCAECGTRYETRATGFCPRCGSTQRRADAPGQPAATAPARRDPARRRVQVGGLLLAVFGFLIVAGSGTVLWKAGEIDDQLQQTLARERLEVPGGELRLRVLADGVPTQANVTLSRFWGPAFSNRTTDAQGALNLTLGDNGAFNLTVRAAGREVTRPVLVLSGLTEEAAVDVVRDPATGPWIGLEPLVRLTRILMGAILASAAAMLLAGVCAMAVRLYPLAVAGPVPILAITLIVTVASLSVGLLVLLAILATALGLIVSGRAAFRR